MSTKQVTNIDFVIEDKVYYSSKALIEYSGKPGKPRVVVSTSWSPALDPEEKAQKS